jgi:STE24 endopeptidase
MQENTSRSDLGEAEAKVYSAIKVRLSILGIALNFIFLALFAFTPLSRWIVNSIEFHFADPYLQFLLFALAAGAVFSCVDFLLDWYGGFYIEHLFSLSNQTLIRWGLERVKSALIGFLIGMPLALLFFFLIRTLGSSWWWVFACAVFGVSVLIARLAPALIFPLFYTFTPLGEGEVRTRISALLEREHVRFRDIFSFNMSKNTKKANAALAGMGGSRRIIFSDTLLDQFTPAQIEVVFAHELGHFRKKHILKNVVLSGSIIFLSFFLCGLVYEKTLYSLGYIQLDDIAALPVLLLYLSVFGFLIMPVTNAVSRAFEREADRYALERTGMAEDFIAAMEKLAAMNLADKEPRPVVEFFFHSHPSLSRRIAAAEKMKG